MPSLTPSLGCALSEVEEEEEEVENVENVEEGGAHLSQLASPQEQGRATSQVLAGWLRSLITVIRKA